MADVFTQQKRSEIMGRIQGRDTHPELLLRSLLHMNGYRFRLHGNKLPGKPDIVLPKYKTVIFVHGCYWHRHEHCKRGISMPTSNIEFWAKKFEGTISRDQRMLQALHDLGWKTIVIWECELAEQTRVLSTLKQALQAN